ncbi:zinc finger CCHC domain-containing protein 9-like [Battus philenor]|uniref:zinc finger CCHC domain-containing protein 9-like n=1 Tax=Battus philenor TaxID=42288 RepID=UPI0035CEBD38
MTRFARAKGSKSSNLKAPEDSTPWEVLKEQIVQSKKENEEAKQRKEAEQKRIENYTNFLKEQKVQKRKATWCDFPETESKKDSVKSNTVIKKKKSDKPKSTTNAQILNEPQPALNTDAKIQNKKKKKTKLLTQELSNNENKTDIQTESLYNNLVSEKSSDNAQSNNVKKKEKRKNKKLQHTTSNNSEETTTEVNTDNKITDSQPEQNSNINNNQKSKKKLQKGQQPTRRKEMNDRSFQLIINGKEIELIRYDGFPIMKKDAERLEELKNNMLKKGIPKSEVQRNMKLERRRAEKALARLKRDVCYNCRKGGHNLSDCPDLKTKIPGVDSAEGVCFKCGSTEHRQFECKVQRDKEFRFATCFICKEAGHIARQCPDNPKGLYPNGGCCKLCGDVTHLKKDCPTTKDKKEETSIKLQTLQGADNIEDIIQKTESTVKEEIRKPKKIKF